MNIAEKILERIECNTYKMRSTSINITNLKESTLNAITKTLEERRYDWRIEEYNNIKELFVTERNFDYKKEDEHKYIYIYGVFYPRYYDEYDEDLILFTQFHKNDEEYELAECKLWSDIVTENNHGNAMPISKKRRKALKHIIKKLEAKNRIFTEIEIEYLEEIGIKLHKENLRIEVI